MQIQAYEIALLLLLLPCVSASRVRGRGLFVPPPHPVPGVRLPDARRDAHEPEQGSDNKVSAIKVPRELEKTQEDKDRRYKEHTQKQLQMEEKQRQWENEVRGKIEDAVSDAIFILREDVASILTQPGDLSIFLEDVKLTDKAENVLARGKTEYGAYFEELRRAVGQSSLNENFTKPTVKINNVKARFFGTSGPSCLWKNDVTVKFTISQNQTAPPLEDPVVAFKCTSVYKFDQDGICKEHEIDDNIQRAVKHFQDLGQGLF